MSVRNALQAFALILALVGVAAFFVSFAAEIGGGESARPRAGDLAGDASAGPGAAFATGGRRRLLEPAPRLRVEVLNAGGREGSAEAATERLRDSGFDVVFFGNAPAFGRDTSVVLARRGGLAGAVDVADALRIPAVRSAPDSTLLVDVSVWLGTDWPPPHEPAESSWWQRVRGLTRRWLGSF